MTEIAKTDDDPKIRVRVRVRRRTRTRSSGKRNSGRRATVVDVS